MKCYIIIIIIAIALLVDSGYKLRYYSQVNIPPSIENDFEESMPEKSSVPNELDNNDLISLVSTRLLTEKDIQGLSASDLRLLRNSIFAIHGRIFKDSELRDYFSSKQWYKPQYEDVTTMLSEIEKNNIDFLYAEELKTKNTDTTEESIPEQFSFPDDLDNDGLIPLVSTRLLTEKDIEGLSASDLKLLRNSIFAIHGRIFKDSELRDYFSSKQWYKPQYEDVTTKLSEIELKNINYLYSEELKKQTTDTNNDLDKDLESMSEQNDAIPTDDSEVIIQSGGVSYYLHKVLPSETMYSICRNYNVTQQEVYDANKGALGNGLIAGMYLRIPYHEGAELETTETVDQKKEEKGPISSSGSNDSQVLTGTNELLIHKVKWNETLYSIAKKYEVTPESIIRANHLATTDLKTGQEIIIPNS